MLKSFLLGAGASVDAGLPVSMQLTREIAEKIDESDRWSGLSQVLHIVIGAMVQHDTGRGAGAFDGVDVERVFAAVRALADRDSIDLSAFVSTWNQNLGAIGRDPDFPSFWADNFRKGVMGGFHQERDLKRAFTEGVESIIGTSGEDMLKRLGSRMLEALHELLVVDPNGVDYLRPVVESGDPALVATLNYDRSVELAAKASARDCDNGLGQWRGGFEWTWRPEANVRLLKLHGSLDYALGNAQLDGMRVRGDRLTYIGEPNGGHLVGGVPAVVFGQGSKLRSDGPFLAMLAEYDRMLADTEWLIVVGYSFRDDHINAALARWLNSEGAQRISVIDPAVDQWKADLRMGPKFFSSLSQGVGGRESSGVPGAIGFPPLASDFLSVGAAQGLSDLLG